MAKPQGWANAGAVLKEYAQNSSEGDAIAEHFPFFSVFGNDAAWSRVLPASDLSDWLGSAPLAAGKYRLQPTSCANSPALRCRQDFTLGTAPARGGPSQRAEDNLSWSMKRADQSVVVPKYRLAINPTGNRRVLIGIKLEGLRAAVSEFTSTLPDPEVCHCRFGFSCR